MADEHHDNDHHFETADVGSAATFLKQRSALRENEHVMIKECPCKIVEMSTSKTGKHGHAKVHMVAIDIFTGTKLADICSSTHNMEVPVVRRREHMLMDIADGFVNLMAPDTCDPKEHLKIPDGEMGDHITEAFEKDERGILVAAMSVCGEEAIMGLNNMPKDN